MEAPNPTLLLRIRALERQLRISQVFALAVPVTVVALAAGGNRSQESMVVDSLRARRIEVVDDQGVVRISIGQDPSDTHRRSRACGITIHDTKGDERGGLGTMDDLSAVIALDAPSGVGGPMRDRIGMMVAPDGSAQLALIDNEMRPPVRLVADAEGGGGLELYGYDLEERVGKLKRVTFDGEVASQFPLGEEK